MASRPEVQTIAAALTLVALAGCSGDRAWEAAQEISVTWPLETTGESESDATITTAGTETSSSGSTTEGPGESESESDATTSSATSTTEAATTTEEPAVCGDGHVGGDEECDDGNADNTDDCLNSCMNPYCGDGLVAKDEECDDGNTENDDGCNNACARDRLVFISSEPYQGNFGTVSGANQVCRGLAFVAGLEKSDQYRAWLSGPEHSPDTRFFKSKGRYVLIDGTPVASNWDDLTDGELLAPINVDENMVLRDTAPVWTNTTTAGKIHPDSQDCGNWFELEFEFKARIGWSAFADVGWTDYPDDPIWCGSNAYLYCFEQE